MRVHRIPRWLTIAYLLWLAVWLPAYWLHYGPVNLLWLCDAANLVVAIALLLESPLLFSSQATGVLVIQAVWVVDFLGGLLFGWHPIGGTEYMFDPAIPLWLRGLSLFHVFVPILLLWAVYRLGYDRRGWILQAALSGILLPISFVAALPERNLNWLWAPFGIEQVLLPPDQYLLACLFVYPVVLYWPSHRLLLWWATRQGITILPRDRSPERAP